MRWEYRHTVLGSCMMAAFVMFFAKLVFSPVVPFIIDDFALSNTQIGLALTGMWLVYGLAQYPSGVVADQYGEKSIILVSIGGTAVASAVVAGAPVFWIFMIVVVLLGGFTGLHYSAATVLLSRTYDDMGTAISIHSLGAPLAGLLAPATGAWIGARYGWRFAVGLSVAISIPAFLVFMWYVRSPEPRQQDQSLRDGFTIHSVLTTLRQPSIAFTLGLAVIATFAVNGIVTFLPTFLVENHSYSATLAGVAFSAYFGFRGILQLGVGPLSDTYGRDFALSLCMLANGAGIVLFVYRPGFIGVTAAVVLAGLGASFLPALEPRFLDRFSKAEAGSDFGLVRSIFIMVGSTGSVGVGLMADHFGWDVSFLVLAVLSCLVVGGLLVNWLFELGY